MKNKRLLYMLIALAVLLGIIYYLDDKPDAVRFDTGLCSFDPEVISIIELQPANTATPVSLYTSDAGWNIRIDGREYMANEGRIKLLKTSFSNLEALRIVANNERNWADYNLDTGQAASIAFFDGTNRKCKIYTGRLGFDHARNTSNTHVRKPDDERTYLVADNLTAQIDIDPTILISPIVTGAFKTDAVTSIELIHNTEMIWRWSLNQSEGLWLNEYEQKAANEKTENYLTALSRLSIDKFNTDLMSGELPENYSIRLGFDDDSSIKLHISINEDEDLAYITSSYRKDQIVFTMPVVDSRLAKLLQPVEDFLPENAVD